MEKRAIETSRQKMAENELEAEKRRLLEEKRLLEKIETGGGKWALFCRIFEFFRSDITDIMHRRTNLAVETEQLQTESIVTNQEGKSSLSLQK